MSQQIKNWDSNKISTNEHISDKTLPVKGARTITTCSSKKKKKKKILDDIGLRTEACSQKSVRRISQEIGGINVTCISNHKTA
jgi:hypothetical protein